MGIKRATTNLLKHALCPFRTLSSAGVLQLWSYTRIRKTKCVRRVQESSLIREEQTRATLFKQDGQHINYSPYHCNSNGYWSLAVTHLTPLRH